MRSRAVLRVENTKPWSGFRKFASDFAPPPRTERTSNPPFDEPGFAAGARHRAGGGDAGGGVARNALRPGNVDGPRLWRIAQPGIGTTLQANLDVEVPRGAIE